MPSLDQRPGIAPTIPTALVAAIGTVHWSVGSVCRIGSVTLEGFNEPIRAWQVIGSSAVPSRFDARHEDTLTPLVGRDEELELLLCSIAGSMPTHRRLGADGPDHLPDRWHGYGGFRYTEVRAGEGRIGTHHGPNLVAAHTKPSQRCTDRFDRWPSRLWP